MIYKIFIFLLLVFVCMNSCAQKIKPEKIYIQYDTLMAGDKDSSSTVIANRADSAYISFDNKFENDTLVIFVDGKLIRLAILNSDFSTGFAMTVGIHKRNAGYHKAERTDLRIVYL